MVAQEPPELLVLLRLLADCSDRAAAVVVEVLLVLAVQAAQEVVALAAAVARVAAAHTQQVPVVWVVLAGHWFWSFDHGQVCFAGCCWCSG